MAAHGGGYLPTYSGRSDHAWSARPDARSMAKPLSTYLKQIYFDNLVYTPQAIEILIRQVGVGQIVLGTDYPFDMGSYDVHGLMASVPGLSEDGLAAILSRNAMRLLGIVEQLD